MTRAADLKHYIATRQMKDEPEKEREGAFERGNEDQKELRKGEEERVNVDYYEHYQYLGRIREKLFAPEKHGKMF